MTSAAFIGLIVYLFTTSLAENFILTGPGWSFDLREQGSESHEREPFFYGLRELVSGLREPVSAPLAHSAIFNE